MARRAAEVRTDLVAKDVSLSKTLKRANKNMGTFERGAKRAGQALKGLGSALLGGGAVVGLTKLISKQINAADSAIKFGRSLGIAVEDMSAYQFAAERSGVNSKALESGIRKLGEALGDFAAGNASEGLNALEKLFGSDLTRISTLPLNQQFEATLELLGQFEDETLALAVAADVFGARYGQALLQLAPDLQGLKREAAEVNAVIGVEFARNAERFKDDLTDMEAQLNSLGRTLADAGVISGLTEFLDLLKEFAEFNTNTNNIFRNPSALGQAAGGSINRALFGDNFRTPPEPVPFIPEPPLPGLGSGANLPPLEGLGVAFDKTAAQAAEDRIKAEAEAARIAAENTKRLLAAKERQLLVEQQIADSRSEQQAAQALIEQGQFRINSLVFSSLPAEEQRAELIKQQIAELETFIDLAGKEGSGLVLPDGTIEALEKYRQKLEDVGKDTKALERITDQAARNMQDAFADFLFDPFEGGVKGMLESFSNALRRMVAEAAAAEIFKSLNFSNFFGGGGGSFATPSGSADLFNVPLPGVTIPGKVGTIGAGKIVQVVNNIDARGADPALLNRLPALLDDNRRRTLDDVQRMIKQRRVG